MKEKPILFSGPMVKAILDGHKTMTRRVIKPQPEIFDGMAGGDWCWWPLSTDGSLRKCPYGAAGDHLWVRETVWMYSNRHEVAGYVADCGNHFEHYVHKTPSIHMPRWASRINLKITGIRVERLQDISAADAQAEGLSCDACGWFVPGNTKTGAPTAVECFSQLWDSINGEKCPWQSNPLVWVVEFKLLGP
jgi:hypothetical protein